jgi:endonuclease G, mitochondrial
MKLMKLIYLSIFLSFFLSDIWSQDKIEHPALKPREEFVQHSFYAFAYIEAYELASWVAYEIKPADFKPNITFKEKYTEDPKVSTGSASMKDYKDAGYVMGQLAPLEDMLYNEKAAAETFYFSNVVPMKPAFQKYTWKKMGDLVREWAKDAGTLYVVTGPVLADSPFPTFGPNMVSVPSRFYKVVLDLKNERGIGFVVKNSMSSGSLKPFAMSIDKIEEITGIDFFSNLDDELEESIESEFDLSKWDFDVIK